MIPRQSLALRSRGATTTPTIAPSSSRHAPLVAFASSSSSSSSLSSSAAPLHSPAAPAAAAARRAEAEPEAPPAPHPYGWETGPDAQAAAAARRAADPRVREVPLASIRRPLGRTRANDPRKVEALARSVARAGLLEPIDVLECEGALYGFSGCHRFEAHQRLGRETILCRVRRCTRETLMMHLR
jgi:sulfiredoxin